MVKGGGVEKWEGVSVQSMGEVGKDFCPNFPQPFLANIDRRSCNDGSRELIPVFHNPHLSFGGGLHLGAPCRGALLGRVVREGGKGSSDQYPKGLSISCTKAKASSL